MAKAADLDALLAHADWLRGLARKLVGSASAEDAVQDTYVAALASPPDPALPPRPWLARVLRNATRMTYRTATRRTSREDAIATIAATPPGVDNAVARAEVFRTLVELVLALDEPYRSTLVRHYFDGDTLADIARRDRIPEATVRGRHKQALERLRARLDAREPRNTWLAALAPLAAPTKSTLGVLVMTKVIAVAAVAIVVGGLAWHFYPHASAQLATPAAIKSPSSATPATTAVTPPPLHVRQFASPAERERLAAQIAAAQTRRQLARSAGAAANTPAPSVAATEGDMDRAVIRSAMQEVLPFLSDCFGDARASGALGSASLEIHAHLDLTGDRDIGTIIDAKQLFDDNMHALPSTVDDCMRGALQTLELPPLGDGDTVAIDYPILFTD